MSSGGGGTNTVQTTIPDWMQQYVQNNYAEGQSVASLPFTPYSGEVVAPLNAMQEAGIGMGANYATNGVGLGAVQSGINAATNAASYTPQSVSYSGPTSAQMSSYENPYTQDVINTTNQQINQQNAIANQQEAGSATAAGAFGGSREAVQQALNNKYYGQIAANTDANLNAENFSQAQQEANTVNAGNLAAAQSNQSAGLTANQQAIQSGMILGNLGATQQGIAMGNANDLTEMGSLSQQQQQALDTYNYNTYMQQLMWPYQQEQALIGATYGGNVGSSTTSPYYSSTLGQIAGLGMAGLGLANSMGWLGAGSAAGSAAAGTAGMAGASDLLDAAVMMA